MPAIPKLQVTRCRLPLRGARPAGRRGFRRGCSRRTSAARAARLPWDEIGWSLRGATWRNRVVIVVGVRKSVAIHSLISLQQKRQR